MKPRTITFQMAFRLLSRGWRMVNVLGREILTSPRGRTYRMRLTPDGFTASQDQDRRAMQLPPTDR